MIISSKFFRYFLILTLINLTIFLNIDESIIEEIEISGNQICNISLKSNEKKSLKFEYHKEENNRTNYISIFPFDNITLESEIKDLKNNITNQPIFLELNNSNYKENNLIINITSKNDSKTQIINIIKDHFTSYKKIEINKISSITNIYNLVTFLKKNEKKIEFKINFKGDINATIYYEIVLLKSNNINYLPRAFNFQTHQNCTNENKEKEIIQNVGVNKYKEDEKKSDFPALIISIETQNKTISYDATIYYNDDALMNIFLICSIALALVFAIITFFLIRRKQKAGTENAGDEFYGEKAEEENDN